MLVKLSQETLAAIGGGANAAEALSNLSTFIAKAQQDAKFMAESKVTLETLQASVTALEGKISGFLTEAKAKEIMGAEMDAKLAPHLPVTKAAITEWANTEEGKKIHGAEGSRIVMAALANVGTQPAKPSPAPAAGGDAQATVQALEAQGKFEEAWAMDKNAQAEFVTAKSYAAFRRAQAKGQVKIASKN